MNLKPGDRVMVTFYGRGRGVFANAGGWTPYKRLCEVKQVNRVTVDVWCIGGYGRRYGPYRVPLERVEEAS